MCDDLPLPDAGIDLCYTAFQNSLQKITKITIPRSFRQKCIPKWGATCDELANDHDKAQTVEEKRLNVKRKELWLDD